MVDRAKAEAAVRTLIEFIGEDPNRPGLQATPRRVVDAWLQSWGIGHREPLPPLTMFDDEIKQREEMIVIRDIAARAFWVSRNSHGLSITSAADYKCRSGFVIRLLIVYMNTSLIVA
jgi:GTP cyclohydrolase I